MVGELDRLDGRPGVRFAIGLVGAAGPAAWGRAAAAIGGLIAWRRRRRRAVYAHVTTGSAPTAGPG